MITSKFSVLLISNSYPPVLGGSEIEAQRVCAALLQRGHRVMVVCTGGPPMPDVPDWVDPAGVPVRIFARRGTGRRKDYTFALAVAWTLLKERRNYELVYFLMQGLHLATGLPVARWLGKPIVMKVSGSSLITLMQNSWIGRLELRWLRKWAHRVMILNQGMAAEAAAAGFEPRHLLWMPNPIDTDKFAPCSPRRREELRGQLGIPSHAALIVFVGRLVPEKELPSLITAFASVVRRMPWAVLVLVGDGPDRKDLEKHASDLDLNASIRFAGRCAPDAVCQWLQASDVFALVSSNEGFPCSLSEAMSAGLPSVVSDIPANTQLIDEGIHGMRARLRDETSIAEALVRLLGDAALRAGMGRAARQRVLDNYSVDKVLDRYEALFEEALANPQT